MLDKNKKAKVKKVRTMKVGTHKKSVIILWVLLLVSVAFGIYKNFTAINVKTVHEKEIVRERNIDTNGIENFVRNFAKNYYAWENNKESIERRTNAIGNYLTEELKALDAETVRTDIPTSAAVKDVQIWNVLKTSDNEYSVAYSVTQTISEEGQTREVAASYETAVHVDDAGNMVIVRNPTLAKIAGKADYEPKKPEPDSTLDAKKIADATAFLETFFKLYPNATEKELSYYVKGNALEPVSGDYLYSELVNPVFNENGNQLKVSVFVKFLNRQTKAVDISQYELTLEKKGNWMIVE